MFEAAAPYLMHSLLWENSIRCSFRRLSPNRVPRAQAVSVQIGALTRAAHLAGYGDKEPDMGTRHWPWHPWRRRGRDLTEDTDNAVDHGIADGGEAGTMGRGVGCDCGDVR